MGLVLIPTEANMERKEGGKKERTKWGKRREEEERMVADVGPEEPREDFYTRFTPLSDAEGAKEAASLSPTMTQLLGVRMRPA